MPDPITVCETAFSVYLDKFPRLANYTGAVTPHLVEAPDAIPIFVDSNVVLLIAWHEDFMKSLLAQGIQHREAVARAFFTKHGNDEERRVAATCDLRALIGMGRRRLSYKKRAAKLERLFVEIFEFPLWPSPAAQNRILDLNTIRQMVVHDGGASLGDEVWDQLSDRQLVATTQYVGLPAIRRIDYTYCLMKFMKAAFLALAEQAYHLRDQMLSRPMWVYQSILAQRSDGNPSPDTEGHKA